MRKPSEIIINEKTLEEILENHQHWLMKDVDGWEDMCAKLEGANLYCTDLSGAKNIPYIPLECPSEGSFIGWKKIDKILIKLEILFCFKGHIRCRPYSVYERWLKTNKWH